MLWLLSTVVLLAEPAISLEEAAQIQREQQKATAAVGKKFGDKKSSELSNDERRELIRAQADAEREVLDKHGIDGKTWARFSATQSAADYAARQALVKELAEKERKAAEAAGAQQPKEAQDIPVQRGISDEQPVVLEESQSGQPIVEKELPPEARADEEAARGADSASAAGDKPGKPGKPGKLEKKAAPKHGKHR